MPQIIILLVPNPHVASNKKLKLDANSIEDLSAQAAEAVKLGGDGVLCRPTDGDPTEADIFTSLEEIMKAKVMVWPESTLYPPGDVEPATVGEEAALEAEFEAASAAEAGVVALSLACPDDCGPGDSVTVEVDGVHVEVEIPDGVAPGDEFEVQIDMGAAAAGDPADEKDEQQEEEEEQPAVIAEPRVVILMVVPNPHCASNKKLKLTASSIEELAAQVATAVKLGEDAIICSPTDGEPTEGEVYTSLDALGDKAKVMVWPEAVLYPAVAAGDDEAEIQRLIDAEAEAELEAETDRILAEEAALEAEFEAASAAESAEQEQEQEQQPVVVAAAMDLEPPMDLPPPIPEEDFSRDFILMIMPNEHVKSNKKLTCSASTLADLAAQVGAACKIDGDVRTLYTISCQKINRCILTDCL